jgi:cytochrome c
VFRQRWDHLLDVMVEKQGMAELPPADRTLILDYLATHLNPDVPRS